MVTPLLRFSKTSEFLSSKANWRLVLSEEGSVSSSDNTNNTLDQNPPTMSEVYVVHQSLTTVHGGTNSPTQ